MLRIIGAEESDWFAILAFVWLAFSQLNDKARKQKLSPLSLSLSFPIQPPSRAFRSTVPRVALGERRWALWGGGGDEKRGAICYKLCSSRFAIKTWVRKTEVYFLSQTEVYFLSRNTLLHFRSRRKRKMLFEVFFHLHHFNNGISISAVHGWCMGYYISSFIIVKQTHTHTQHILSHKNTRAWSRVDKSTQHHGVLDAAAAVSRHLNVDNLRRRRRGSRSGSRRGRSRGVAVQVEFEIKVWKQEITNQEITFQVQGLKPGAFQAYG
jgi:hypothetical protein